MAAFNLQKKSETKEKFDALLGFGYKRRIIDMT